MGNFYMVRYYMALKETVSDDIEDRVDYGFLNDTHPNKVFFHTYYRLVSTHSYQKVILLYLTVKYRFD